MKEKGTGTTRSLFLSRGALNFDGQSSEPKRGKPPFRTFETFILEGLQLLLKASQGAIMMLKVESLKGPEGRVYSRSCDD